MLHDFGEISSKVPIGFNNRKEREQMKSKTKLNRWKKDKIEEGLRSTIPLLDSQVKVESLNTIKSCKVSSNPTNIRLEKLSQNTKALLKFIREMKDKYR